MSLERKAIRRKFVSLIKHGRTDADKNVFANRTNKNWIEDLPAVNIYIESESGNEIFQPAPLVFSRYINLTLDCVVKGRDEEEASDNLDDLTDQIEQLIGTAESYDEDFRCLLEEILPSGASFDFDEEGSQVVASCALAYRLKYYANATRNPGKLDQLTKMGAEYSLGVDSENELTLSDVPV